MPEFPGFIGAAYQAPSIYQDAQESINWYCEIDPDSGARAPKALYPTPGLTQRFAFPNQGEVRVMYVLPGGASMLAVCGNLLYFVALNFLPVLVGTLLSNNGNVSITDNLIVAYIVDGSNRYTYNLATGFFQVLPGTDGAFKGGDTCHYIEDFIVYNKPGSNQWAATSPLSAITAPLSFSSKDAATDNIVAISVDHREVFLFGEYTTEIWINQGAFPFPFVRLPGTMIQHGCAARRSITKLGESQAWLAKDSRGQAIVAMLQGYIPIRISTHAVENDIMYGIIDDAVAYTYQQRGHSFYVISFPSQDKTWVYDFSTTLWHKWCYVDSMNAYHRHLSNCHAVFSGMNLVGDATNGIVYSIESKTYTDNGHPIKRLRRCPHIVDGLNRVYYNHLQLQFQPGVGLTLGQGSQPKVMLRWSDDGGSTWSQFYPLPIGALGQFKNRCIKRKMGFARDRVYEITMTEPVNAVLIAAELQTDSGES